MHNQRDKNRVYFIDYLRGLMVLYVVLDHAMHIYSPHYKNFHRFQDFGGNLFFDVWHMHNDVIMMPLLYFLAGLFVLPSLQRRGCLSFAKEKFYRLVVPFVLGCAIIVPPQTYIAKLIKQNLDQSYLDYWFNSYFWADFSSSAFWFLYYLAVLTILLIAINTFLPSFIKLLGRFASWLVNNPVKGFITFFAISAIIIGASEIIWNAQYWTGFWQAFYIRGGRFLMKGFLFFLGAGVAYAGITKNQDTLTNIGNAWKQWLILSIIAGVAYITYTLSNFHTGAYTVEFMRHFYHGGTLGDIWPLITAYGGPFFTRSVLMTLFMCSLVVMYISVFKHFLDKPLPKWQNLAACSFGIYIFHEPFTHIVQYYYIGSDTSEYIKFLATVLVSTAVSWGGTYLLKDLPGFKKVL